MTKPYDKPAAGFPPQRVVLLCGCFLLLGSLGTAVYRIAFLRRAVHADATIVGYAQDPPGRGYVRSSARDPGCRAVFVYRTADGRGVQATSPRSAADHVPLRPVGTSMSVVYDPADPAHAVPDTWPALWTPTITLAVLGAALLGMRVVFLAVRSRS